jgi:hypothetical protein
MLSHSNLVPRAESGSRLAQYLTPPRKGYHPDSIEIIVRLRTEQTRTSPLPLSHAFSSAGFEREPAPCPRAKHPGPEASADAASGQHRRPPRSCAALSSGAACCTASPCAKNAQQAPVRQLSRPFFPWCLPQSMVGRCPACQVRGLCSEAVAPMSVGPVPHCCRPLRLGALAQAASPPCRSAETPPTSLWLTPANEMLSRQCTHGVLGPNVTTSSLVDPDRMPQSVDSACCPSWCPPSLRIPP